MSGDVPLRRFVRKRVSLPNSRGFIRFLFRWFLVGLRFYRRIGSVKNGGEREIRTLEGISPLHP